MEVVSLIFTILNSIILITTVIECIFVLILFRQHRLNRKISHNFVISLCVADLINTTFGCGVLIHMGFGLKLIDKSCHYEVSLLSSSHTISLVCTVVTSLDRYFAIAHPMEYQSKMTSKLSYVLITMGWLIGSAIGFSTLLFPQEVSKLRPVVLQRLNTTSCILVANVIKPEYLACISFGFVLPCILVTIIVYALIYRAIVNVFNSSTIKSSKRSFLVWLKMQREMEESGDIRFSEMLKIREVRATIIIFLTVIIFLLCWLPVVLILVVHKIKPIIGSLDEIFLVFTLLKIYSMINPVVYAFTLKDIRKPFVLLVKRVFCCDKNRLTTLEGRTVRKETSTIVENIELLNL